MTRTFMLGITVLSATVWVPVVSGGDSSREIKAKAALLKADDWKIRKSAVEDLASIDGQESGDLLLAVLMDPFEEDYVREAAVAGLAKKKDKRAVGPLIQILKIRRAALLTAAAKALAESGDDRAVAPIAAAVPRAGPARGDVLCSLLQFKDKAVDPLLAILNKASNADLHHPWAIRGLGQTGSPRAVLPVAAFLKSPVAKLRYEAAAALRELGDERAVPALAEALANRDPKVRCECARAFTELRGNESVAPLMRMLTDNDEDIRNVAVSALGRQEDRRAVPALMATLKDPIPHVRAAAAIALQELGAKEARALLEGALRDPDSYVRLSAARALDKLGWVPQDNSARAWHLAAKGDFMDASRLGKSAQEPLLLALRGPWADRAAKALDQIGWQPRTDAEWAWQLAGKRLWDEAARLGEAAVEPLAAAVERTPGIQQEKAIAALGATNSPKAAKLLLPSLNHRSYECRRAASKALVKLGSKAVEALVASMKETAMRDKRHLVDALEELKWSPATVEEKVYYLLLHPNTQRDILKITPPPTNVLLEVLKHKDPMMRGDAAMLLGLIKNESTAEPLIALLGDEDSFVHSGVCSALEQLASVAVRQMARAPSPASVPAGSMPASLPATPEVIVRLTAALKSPLPRVRAAAASVLGKAGVSSAAEDLVLMLNDAEPQVRESAVSALNSLYCEKLVPVVQPLLEDSDANVRRQAWFAFLKPYDKPDMKLLVRATKQQDEIVRLLAARMLANSEDKAAVDTLIRLLDDESDMVSEEAAIGLGNLADQRAVEPLLAALETSFIRIQLEIIKALGKLRDARAVPGLIGFMRLETASYGRHNPAGEALVNFGPAAVEPLIAATKSPYALVRSRSAWTLGQLRDPRAIQPLADLADDPSPQVKKNASVALAKLRQSLATSRPASAPSSASDRD